MTGRLLCDGVPASGVELELYDHDSKFARARIDLTDTDACAGFLSLNPKHTGNMHLSETQKL